MHGNAWSCVYTAWLQRNQSSSGNMRVNHCFSHGGGGGRLQPVLMRHPPAICQTLGGGEFGGGRLEGVCRGGGFGRVGGSQGGGACTRPTTTTCIPPGRIGGLGYGGIYVIIALSGLCQEESLQGPDDEREARTQKNFGTVGAMAPTPLSLKTRGGGGGAGGCCIQGPGPPRPPRGFPLHIIKYINRTIQMHLYSCTENLRPRRCVRKKCTHVVGTVGLWLLGRLCWCFVCWCFGCWCFGCWTSGT